MQRWQMFTTRVLFLSYVLFTATYCLLGYIAFTYQQVIVGELLPSVTALAHLHHFLFWPAYGCALMTIIGDLKSGPARYLARGFAGMGFVAGTALLVHPLLPGLTNDASSLWWCLLSLSPLLWIAMIDWVHGKVAIRNVEADDDISRPFLTCIQVGIFLALTYFGIGALRAWAGKQLQPSWPQASEVLLWTLLSHLLLLLLVFVALDLSVITAAAFPGRWFGRLPTLGAMLTVMAILGLVFRYVIFPPLAFSGVAASLVAMMLSLSLTAFFSGTGFRLSGSRRHNDDGALDLLFEPFFTLGTAPRIAQVLALIGLAGLAWILSMRTSRLDWGFVIQKLAVVLVSTVAFAIFYTVTAKAKRLGRVFAYSTAVIVLICYLGLATIMQGKGVGADPSSAMSAVLERYSGYDISFRFVNEIIRPVSNAGTDPSTDSFYAFLARNTNIRRSVHLLPADISLVDHLARSTHRRPHIFFLVIDSLRRDYLAPYNPAVNFTPAINSLAQDSVVFRNAFTHYGGTGLSEPSIWVGGLMLHQQYITPFGPMNSLQKLLDINGYREWISKDNILQQVVPSSPNITELDEHVGAMSYDLCRTLKELTARLPTVTSTDNPVFVYTQAQNIHVSVIDRAGRSVPEGAIFPAGFDPAYASRLQTIDGCIGRFVDTLKKDGIYDDSVIVVTSDHGDSLGEMGRWDTLIRSFQKSFVSRSSFIYRPG